MAQFEIHQCTNPDCLLRIPLDREIHQGAFCPRCGAPMTFEIEVIPQGTPDAHDKPHTRSIGVLLDNIRSAHNVGSIFRTADAIGADRLYLCGITPIPTQEDAIQKTALGAEENVPWQYDSNALQLTLRLKTLGFNLIALESAPQAIPLYHFQIDHADQRPVVLVLGNERAGVDPEIINLCDSIVALPMLGKKRSLNVAVAFGTAAYWLSFGHDLHQAL
jgi:tRNA G18 (ribose-2'-O)-methylase SpoU